MTLNSSNTFKTLGVDRAPIPDVLPAGERSPESTAAEAGSTDRDWQAKLGERYQLSEREMTVLAYIGAGYSAKRIAALLFISPATVYSHTKKEFDKARK